MMTTDQLEVEQLQLLGITPATTQAVEINDGATTPVLMDLPTVGSEGGTPQLRRRNLQAAP